MENHIPEDWSHWVACNASVFAERSVCVLRSLGRRDELYARVSWLTFDLPAARRASDRWLGKGAGTAGGMFVVIEGGDGGRILCEDVDGKEVLKKEASDGK